ncbi:unnamed protein product, partial [Prorocentrum cordatum]
VTHPEPTTPQVTPKTGVKSPPTVSPTAPIYQQQMGANEQTRQKSYFDDDIEELLPKQDQDQPNECAVASVLPPTNSPRTCNLPSPLLHSVLDNLCASEELRLLMRAKGIPDSANADLLNDIDDDGRLVNPSRWGVNLKDKIDAEKEAAGCGARKDPSQRNKGTPDEEVSFWQSIAAGGYSVPTDTKVSAVAGRWERAYKASPDMQRKYDAITGENKRSKRH